MTNREMFEMLSALTGVSGLKGVKFAYAVAKNKKLIEAEIKTINSVNAPTGEFIVYDNLRMQLCEKHTRYDGAGEIVLIDSPDGRKEYDIVDREAFDADLEELRQQHLSAVEEQEKKQAEFDKFLEECSTLELHMVDVADLPNDINATQLISIRAMVVDV